MTSVPTFTERLHRRKQNHNWLNLTNPWVPASLDKLLAKDMVATLGVRMPQTYWTGEDPAMIGPLPPRFVLKAARGAGSQQVCVMDGDYDVIHHRHLSRPQLLELAASWQQGPLIAEELLQGEDGRIPPFDYKCYAFGPHVVTIAIYDRLAKRSLWRDANWCEPLPALDSDKFSLGDPSLSAPACLDALVQCASQLGRCYGTFIRVDLYATPDGPVFGEFCPIPLDGHCVPVEADRWLGERWATLVGEAI